jgi:Bifunctional DNA primase/polymerase, N-terminal/AAA domain
MVCPQSKTEPFYKVGIVSDDKLHWALELASRGIRILPVHFTNPDGSCSCGKPMEGEGRCRTPGKHPDGYRWEALATTNPETIKGWFKKQPKMNYGLLAGDSMLLYDMDVKDADGWQTAADTLDISKAHVKDQTFCVRTPSGGGHLYFKAHREYGNTSRTALGPGIDTRSGNGQVLGPGSGNYIPDLDEFGEPLGTLTFKKYEVLNDAPFAEIPKAIEVKLTRAKDKVEDAQDSALPSFIDHPAAIERVRKLLKLRKPAIEGQGGDNHTLVTIYICRDHNLSPEATLALLTEDDGWNDRCDPPWDVSELQGKIDNAYAYAREKQGNKGGMLLEAAEALGVLTGDPDIDGDSILPKDFDAPAKPKFVFYDGEHINTLDIHYDFIIEGWLPDKNFTIILGDRGSGKTTFIMDAVCSVAADAAWHGARVDKDWMIFYIAAEDFPGVKERYEAWCTKNRDHCSYNEQTKRWQLKDPSRIQFIDMTINLLDEDEVFEFGMAVTRLKKKIEEEKGKPTRVIFVFDTWQRVTAAAEGGQSNDESIQKAAGNLEALGRALNGPCIIAAHPPKSNANTMSGSAITENRSDSVWQVFNKEGMNGEVLPPNIRRLMLTRSKGSEIFVHKDFMFSPIDIAGVDKFGQQRKSVAVDYRGGSSTKNPAQDEKTETQKADDLSLMRLIRDVFWNLGNHDPEANKDGKPVTVAMVCKVLNEVMHGTAPAGSTFTAAWKKKIYALGYTEHHKFPKYTTPTSISKSSFYNRVIDTINDSGRTYDLWDGMALTIYSHKNAPTLKVIPWSNGSMMQAYEDSEEPQEIVTSDGEIVIEENSNVIPFPTPAEREEIEDAEFEVVDDAEFDETEINTEFDDDA